MITGLDHATLLVNDVEGACRNYAALLGRSPDWLGARDGVRLARFALGNTALEIVAPDGNSAAADALRARIVSSGEGLHGLAFAVRDLDAALRVLERRGVAMHSMETVGACDTGGAERSRRMVAARTAATHGIAQQFFAQTNDRWLREGQEPAGIDELDHVVIRTPNADRAVAHYGARLGLDLRLERANAQWGSRLFFFRCGNLVVEIGTGLKPDSGAGLDSFGGLAWRMRDARQTHQRLAAAGFALSELRKGRKPGTHVFTVKDRTSSVPTLMIETGPAEARKLGSAP